MTYINDISAGRSRLRSPTISKRTHFVAVLVLPSRHALVLSYVHSHQQPQHKVTTATTNIIYFPSVFVPTTTQVKSATTTIIFFPSVCSLRSLCSFPTVVVPVPRRQWCSEYHHYRNPFPRLLIFLFLLNNNPLTPLSFVTSLSSHKNIHAIIQAFTAGVTKR